MTASSEERLLKLIKGQYKKKVTKKETAIAAKKKTKLAASVSSFRAERFGSAFFRQFNLILLLVLISALAYLGYEFIRPRNNFSISKIDKKAAPALNQSPKKTALPYIEDYSVYSKAIGAKKLFSVSQSQKAKRPQAPAMDVSKRFSLVGIIAGDNLQAIIEDKDTSKTYYLYEQDSFNGVIVEEIKKGRVILDYNGESLALIL